jgi:hypothetical protein
LATSSAKVSRRSMASSAIRQTSQLACKPSPSRVRS